MVFICFKFEPRPGVTLAYRRFPGRSKTLPGVFFLGGFRSDMQGTKATYLEAQCEKRQQSFVRFDYAGHGMSGGKFEDGTIGSWLQDALDVFDRFTRGPQVIVGSSMGGWLALLLALRRSDRAAGLLGIAPAPDFSEDIYNNVFGEEERRHLARTGLVYMPNDYGDPHPLTARLFEEAKKHLLLNDKINIHCPVRLIHGKQDRTVPWERSVTIRERLVSPDVKISWVGDGDHRLSREQDLKLIDDAVVELSHIYQMKLAGNG